MTTYDSFKTIELNWGNVYDGKPEDLPHSFPPPMEKPVLISRFVDANVMSDLTMGISQTGIILLLNNTPI